jgi:serpin B
MKASGALLAAASIGFLVAAEPAKIDTTAVAHGNNRFAVDLYRQLSRSEGNLFLSPYSIYTALAMTSAGAGGRTSQQMEEKLHFPARQVLPQSMAALIGSMKERRAKMGLQLNSANALWAAQGYPLKQEFLTDAKDHYGADVTNLDFASDPDGSRKTINRWVEKETKDKIRNLIPPGTLMPDTRLVLTNAIYFKGNWEHPFYKSSTREEDFRLSSARKSKTPLMHRIMHCAYTETDSFQALQLPYSGNELAMVALLPKKDDLAGLEEKVSTELIESTVAKLAARDVIVTLPRFKTTAEFELVPTLKKLGLTLPFGPDADFSGITAEPIRLSNVIHKAFVDLNEEGTEAAAATAIIATPTAAAAPPGPLPVFRADHPFIYMIRDIRSGSILFIGRLADPSK